MKCPGLGVGVQLSEGEGDCLRREIWLEEYLFMRSQTILFLLRRGCSLFCRLLSVCVPVQEWLQDKQSLP